MDKGPYYKLQDVDFWNFAYRLKVVSKTSKFFKIRRHSWGTPLIEILSRSRRARGFDVGFDDCGYATEINDRIKRKLNASLFYQSLQYHFSSQDLNRPNFAKMLAARANEEREHAEVLAKFQLERGYEVNVSTRWLRRLQYCKLNLAQWTQFQYEYQAASNNSQRCFRLYDCQRNGTNRFVESTSQKSWEWCS